MWVRSGPAAAPARRGCRRRPRVASRLGRIVEACVTITPVDEEGRYSASMRVSQGGQLLGDVTVSGESSEHTVMLDLFARLEALP